jgi:hypothetical protein
MKAECDEISEGVLPRIPQRFRHQQQNGHEGHEAADGIKKPIDALERDQTYDPEKRSCAHKIASHGKAVLPGGDIAARGEVSGRSAGTPRRPKRNRESRGDEGEEYRERNGQSDASLATAPIQQQLSDALVYFCRESQI